MNAKTSQKIKKGGLLFIFLLLIYLSMITCEVKINILITGILNGLGFILKMFPPNINVISKMVYPALETIIIALLSTIFGVILSFFFALCGASNIVPSWLKATSRFLMAVERALPEIIFLLLLVSALGIGPFPGVVALSIGCVGMLGRLFADAMEEVNAKTMEAVASVGASKLQIVQYVVIPEILPSLIANSLFRLEMNIRLSVLLGAVGAGGIGYEINYYFGLLEYKKATTAFLMVLLLVFLTERLSDYLRKRIIKEGKLK